MGNEKNKNLIILILSLWGLALTAYIIKGKVSVKISKDQQNALEVEPLNSKKSRREEIKNKRQKIDPYEEKQVKNTIIKRGTSGIQNCYNLFLETKPIITSGKVELDWQIKLNGIVEKAEIVKSELNNLGLHNCIIQVIQKIQFPPPPGSQSFYIFHKFLFKKKEKK